jgi:hypothetical protein
MRRRSRSRRSSVRGRPSLYDQAVHKGWSHCGKRQIEFVENDSSPVAGAAPLTTAIATDRLLASLEKHGRMAVDPTVKTALSPLSAATIDRLLAPTRWVASVRRKPWGPSRLRRKMLLRTFAEWGGARIREMKMDLVAHCGTVTTGRYVSSLVLADVVSGWTDCATLVVRSRDLIVGTLERLRQPLLFPLFSLDTDNGVECVNEVLAEYCANLTGTATTPRANASGCFPNCSPISTCTTRPASRSSRTRPYPRWPRSPATRSPRSN